ncbi:TPA: hypothetical protein ACS78B_003741 [Providencia alcalifaciens]|uniref:hypothetical protein n=1 Tax=Providencia alcalifaciens TaxID=126385 RepID=UPI001CC3F056|nr:hypothetical protein NVI2019_NGLDDFDA_01634 [Providencia alcalifaciens]
MITGIERDKTIVALVDKLLELEKRQEQVFSYSIAKAITAIAERIEMLVKEASNAGN